ncbi:YjiH family protein [Leucobacter triazinivorans]|uniref:YjiH family protein n=1 Tax=Leucobacter triazinivorans TaxID=1784719 RepID=A0A4P6KG89_9MICO|nr:YjiH family protein [Leucobacter triazinivorans]QBE49477.1 YjiH family protein [Leucobacter triazinivorans]
MEALREFRPVKRRAGVWRFFVFSGLGAFVFFVPVTLAGTSTIVLDHLVSAIRVQAAPVVPWIILALIALGTVRPFLRATWRQNPVRLVFALLNVCGLAVAVLMLFPALAPGWLMADDLAPFLWDKLVIPVGLMIPVGAVFLALLVGYGLMEFVGVLVQGFMRPIFRTPGRAAVDAVASFVGSYSLGLLITNRVYREGKYTAREAAIIATGFSTVSVTFMIVVAKTLGLMDHWLLYFTTTLVVTFVVTALVVRIPPLSRIPQAVFPGAAVRLEEPVARSRLQAAWREARLALDRTPGLWRNVYDNLRDGVVMAGSILPSILSVGLLGLIVAKFTPVFDWLGWIIAPVAWGTGMDDPPLVGKAVALGLVEMFLPATQVADVESLPTRFVVGVVSIAGIIFFSAMVPSILATDIPIRMRELVIIWFERVVLTMVLAAPVAHLLL